MEKKTLLIIQLKIKIFDKKALVIDMENQLRCFSIETGELIWSVKTQGSILRSQKNNL